MFEIFSSIKQSFFSGIQLVLPRFSSFSSASICHSQWSQSSIFKPLLIISLAVLFSNCGLDVEDPTPLLPIVWVQKSLPEEWPEQGIDAHESGGIYLEWVNRAEDNVRVYEIYRTIWFEEQDSLGVSELLAHLEVNTIQLMEYIDNDVYVGIQYKYFIQAIDESGTTSMPSDTIQYSLLTAIELEYMFPNDRDEQLPDDRKLSWRYNYAIEMEDYVITILSEENELISRQIFTPQNYLGWTEYWKIADEIELESGSIYRWRVEVGADHIGGAELSGSESNWASFIYYSD